MSEALATPMDVKLMNGLAWSLYAAFAVVLLSAALAWGLRSKMFSIHSIVVTGDVQHNNAATLRANVVPRLAGSFFTMDLARSRQVFESVPWVRKAVVKRDFPNSLKVVLQEHQAVAYWGAEGESRLINNHGEVFEANLGEVEQESLPRLDGPEGQAKVVLAAYHQLKPLFAHLDLELEQLELSGRGSWLARLDTGATLHLGRGATEEVAERTQRFLKTLTQVASTYGRRPEAIESADLRHEGGYAIRLRGVTTVAPAQAKQDK